MTHTPRHRASDADETVELDPMDATTEMSGLDILQGGGERDDDERLTRLVPIQSGGTEPMVAVPTPAARAVRAVFRSGGELLVTFGLIVLLFVGYQLYGRLGIIGSHQRDLDRQLVQAWTPPTPAAAGPAPSSSATPPALSAVAHAEGAAIGRLYIPRLGLNWVVVEGVSLADLRYAPGHYPGTAMPGQVGNFSAAGHRERGIFWDLDQVVAGDFLIMETKTTWYVYQAFQNHLVTPTSIEVIAPTPNKPGIPPTSADITLTTCNPKWDNYQRMAVHGTLVLTSPHDVRPPQLGS